MKRANHPSASPVAGQAFRFALVGVLATALHYALYYLLLKVNWGENLAYTVGYFLSFLFNYYLTAYFTFRSKPSWQKLMGMGGAHGVNYLLHLLLLNLYLWMGIPNVWAPIPVYAVAVPVNFLLVRYVFHHAPDSAHTEE